MIPVKILHFKDLKKEFFPYKRLNLRSQNQLKDDSQALREEIATRRTVQVCLVCVYRVTNLTQMLTLKIFRKKSIKNSLKLDSLKVWRRFKGGGLGLLIYV